MKTIRFQLAGTHPRPVLKRVWLWGLGFEVQGPGFRVRVLGFGDSGSKVQQGLSS